jgi:predicted GNAT family acetyltransferase
MEILHKEARNKGAFYIEEDGKKLAEMAYSRYSEGHIIIDHTEVDDALRGRGAGKKMLTHAVEWARENNIKITPVCSFAYSLFEKISDFEDVWDKA